MNITYEVMIDREEVNTHNQIIPIFGRTEWKSQHGKLRVADEVEPGDSENKLKKKMMVGLEVGPRGKGYTYNISNVSPCIAETNTALCGNCVPT